MIGRILVCFLFARVGSVTSISATPYGGGGGGGDKIPTDDITRRIVRTRRSPRPNLLFRPMAIVEAMQEPGP